MKKILPLLMLTLLACSSKDGVRWIDGDFATALEAGYKQNKPILVDFYSPT